MKSLHENKDQVLAECKSYLQCCPSKHQQYTLLLYHRYALIEDPVIRDATTQWNKQILSQISNIED